jgi:hypothetical protein
MSTQNTFFIWLRTIFLTTHTNRQQTNKTENQTKIMFIMHSKALMQNKHDCQSLKKYEIITSWASIHCKYTIQFCHFISSQPNFSVF